MSKNLKNFNYDDYEDYDEYDDNLPSFRKITTKPKKYKGHQSKHQDRQINKWSGTESVDVQDDSDENYISYSEKEAIDRKAKYLAEREKSNEENTHEIKGIKINFNGVLKIEKVNSIFKEKPSYGIKFYFKGKNNSFKHIWFNQRQRERDMVFQQESLFLEKIQNKKNNG